MVSLMEISYTCQPNNLLKIHNFKGRVRPYEYYADNGGSFEVRGIALRGGVDTCDGCDGTFDQGFQGQFKQLFYFLARFYARSG